MSTGLKTGKYWRLLTTTFFKIGCNKPLKYIEIKVKSQPGSISAKKGPQNSCHFLQPDQIHNWKAYCAVFTESKRATHA